MIHHDPPSPRQLLALTSLFARHAQPWWLNLGATAIGGSAGVVDSFDCPEGG